MSGFVNKLANILMPIEEIEEVEEVAETAAVQNTVRGKKVVNGNDLYGNDEYKSSFARPQLTLHTNKVPELNILVYVPESFDKANVIADALKKNEAVIVNYEKVDGDEQRRLCDFINGVCYVLNGAVKRISAEMVLYVPENVDIAQEVCAKTVRGFAK